MSSWSTAATAASLCAANILRSAFVAHFAAVMGCRDSCTVPSTAMASGSEEVEVACGFAGASTAGSDLAEATWRVDWSGSLCSMPSTAASNPRRLTTCACISTHTTPLRARRRKQHFTCLVCPLRRLASSWAATNTATMVSRPPTSPHGQHHPLRTRFKTVRSPGCTSCIMSLFVSSCSGYPRSCLQLGDTNLNTLFSSYSASMWSDRLMSSKMREPTSCAVYRLRRSFTTSASMRRWARRVLKTAYCSACWYHAMNTTEVVLSTAATTDMTILPSTWTSTSATNTTKLATWAMTMMNHRTWRPNTSMYGNTITSANDSHGICFAASAAQPGRSTRSAGASFVIAQWCTLAC